MNKLEINVYANGVIGVSGSGNNYENFYKWQRNLLSSKDVNISWPWHYFILNSAEEYKEFFSKYRNNISFVKKDYV